MTNCNCLEGIACPQCGNDSKIIIAVNMLAEVTDDGAETFGDMNWDDASHARCPDCGYWSTLGAFRNQPDPSTRTNEE